MFTYIHTMGECFDEESQQYIFYYPIFLEFQHAY